MKERKSIYLYLKDICEKKKVKNIDKELTEWAIHKIQTEYKEDVALLIGQIGGGKIPTDEQNMVFDFFVPATERGNQLARTFIIEDMGYDLYPISWERLEKIANIEEPRVIFAFAKGEVIYAKSPEEKVRYEKLKNQMLLNLQDLSFQMPKSLEFMETAQEIFQTMLFEEKLCNIRKAAGGVCSYLMNVIALLNGTYLENGYMDLLGDLHRMKEYPYKFEKTFLEMLSTKEIHVICEKVYKLIKMTRSFLKEKMPVIQKTNFEPDYNDLALWYQEMRYTFRRMKYYIEIASAEISYLLGCYMQIEFDAVREDFNLEKMDLMSAFDKEDLGVFAKRAEEIEAYLIKTLEENHANQNKYASFEEFIKEN